MNDWMINSKTLIMNPADGKYQILKDVWQIVNTSKTCDQVIGDRYYLLPNNGNKYFLYIHNNSEYKGLHFFHHSLIQSEKFESQCDSPKEFFIELPRDHSILKQIQHTLFEGYLYKSSAIQAGDFCISDFLYSQSTGSQLILPYETRYFHILNKFLQNQALYRNIDLSINIKVANPFFETKQVSFLVKNNQYANEITHIEYISNFNYFQRNNVLVVKQHCEKQETKLVIKTELTEVYKVHNIFTHNSEGILYIPSTAISKHLRSTFQDVDRAQLTCLFNPKFGKWQYVEDNT